MMPWQRHWSQVLWCLPRWAGLVDAVCPARWDLGIAFAVPFVVCSSPVRALPALFQLPPASRPAMSLQHALLHARLQALLFAAVCCCMPCNRCRWAEGT